MSTQRKGKAGSRVTTWEGEQANEHTKQMAKQAHMKAAGQSNKQPARPAG